MQDTRLGRKTNKYTRSVPQSCTFSDKNRQERIGPGKNSKFFIYGVKMWMRKY